MPFKGVDAVDVVCVYDTRGAEPAEKLSQEVDGESPPREFAVEAETECYGGVQEPAGVAGDVDA